MPQNERTTLTHLGGLLEVSRLIRSGDDLDILLDATARTIAESGFAAIVINIYRPAWDDFQVTTVYGDDPAARELLLGTTNSLEAFQPLLEDRFHWRGAYLIPHDEVDWASLQLTTFVPQLPESDDPEAWHPQDSLMVPMTGSDGSLLGIISIDEPTSGRRPSDGQLDLLVTLARHAALAVEHAQEAVAAGRHRKSLQRLLELSTQLNRAFSIDALFQSLCEGISEALGFQRVLLELVDADTGKLTARAGVGFPDELANTSISVDELHALIDPEYEIEGCFLFPSGEAELRVGKPVCRSVMNGRGPHAWNHHWLLVPLYDAGGSITGAIWCDEPEDLLLPSNDRLQPLRMFASQATIALESTARFNEVRTAKDILQTLVEASPLAIVALDRSANVRLWNSAATRIFGFGEDEIVGRPLSLSVTGVNLRAVIDSVFRGETAKSLEFEGTRQDQSKIELAASAAPLCDRAGNVNGVVCLIADVTDRKQLDKKLQDRQKLESIGILAGGIAHDFNNLLVGMLGNASLALLEMEPDSPARESVEGIELAARRAAELTQQLLAYSGKGQFVVERVNLSTLVDDNVQLLRSVVSKRTSFHVDLAPDLPPVEGDPTQLRQVVMNLIMNASEAGAEGSEVAVHTGVVELTHEDLAETLHADGAKPGWYVLAEVSDTGPGIDPAIRDKIFDPFFTTKFTGRGLGLAAVIGIVRSHHGAISLISEPGTGTTFRVLLPALEPPRAAGVVDGDGRAHHANGGTVLVVDDEEVVRKLAERILNRAGVEALPASDGPSAIELYRRHHESISAVLLDMTMPGLDGKDVYDSLVEINPDVRVILSSGYSETEVLRGFQHNGEYAVFLQKPYNSEQLLDAVMNAAVN